MSHSYITDTFAWIEYLIGSRHGLAAKKYIEGGKAATTDAAIDGLAEWFLREIGLGRRSVEEMNHAFECARTMTLVVGLDEPLVNPVICRA